MMDRRQIDWPMFWLANGRPRSATRRDAGPHHRRRCDGAHLRAACEAGASAG